MILTVCASLLYLHYRYRIFTGIVMSYLLSQLLLLFYIKLVLFKVKILPR